MTTGQQAINRIKEMEKKPPVKQDLPGTLTPPVAAKSSKKAVIETETESNVFISRIENPISDGSNGNGTGISRIKWTLEEEELFADAIRTHGAGNWVNILMDGQYKLVSSALADLVRCIICVLSCYSFIIEPISI